MAGSAHIYAYLVTLILESNLILGLMFYSPGHLNASSLGGTIGKAKKRHMPLQETSFWRFQSLKYFRKYENISNLDVKAWGGPIIMT